MGIETKVEVDVKKDLSKTLCVYTDLKTDGMSEDYGGVGYYRTVQPAKAI